MGPTRWGIVSSGLICHDFTNAICSTYDETEHQVVAISARKQKSADDFAAKFKIPKAYEGYEKLAQDENVDVVYIGSINPSHFPTVLCMLNAGKNVLCEKPLGMNFKEAETCIKLAKEKKLFFMEAIWSRCFPTYHQLKEELFVKKSIGDVKYLEVAFGRDITLGRLTKMELGGGAILDLGVYTVQLANLVFNKEEPTEVKAVGYINDEGTDDSVSALLKYSDGKTANLTVNSRLNLPCVGTVYGTKGQVSLEFPFNGPTQIKTPEGIKEFKLPEKKIHEYNFGNSAGLAYEAQHVRECLQKGLLESPLVDHFDSLQIARLMENIRKQVGVKYPQDD